MSLRASTFISIRGRFKIIAKRQIYFIFCLLYQIFRGSTAYEVLGTIALIKLLGYPSTSLSQSAGIFTQTSLLNYNSVRLVGNLSITWEVLSLV